MPEIRISPSIKRLVLSDDIDLVFQRSSKASLTISAFRQEAEKSVKYVERNGKLVLWRNTLIECADDGVRYEANTMPSATRVPVTVTLAMPYMPFLCLQGTGRVELMAIEQNELIVEMAGSGEVLASGQVQRITVKSSDTGTCSLNAQALYSSEAHILLDGSGSIEVMAMDAVKARMTGEGSLRVHGRPLYRETQVRGCGALRFC